MSHRPPCALTHIIDLDCEGCLRCLPRYLCGKVELTPAPEEAYGVLDQCCTEYKLRLQYYCFTIDEGNGLYNEAKYWIGSGGCVDGYGGIEIKLDLIKDGGVCKVRVQCVQLFEGYIYFNMEAVETCPAAIPAEMTFSGTDADGVGYDVTLYGDQMADKYFENPLSIKKCGICRCATILPKRLCASLYVFIRLGYGDAEGEAEGFECGNWVGNVTFTWDCNSETWAQDNVLTINGYEYVISIRLAEDDCVVIASVEGGPFIAHDVELGGITIPANTAYHLLDAGADPCFGQYACYASGSFYVGQRTGRALCEPGPEDTAQNDHWPNVQIDFAIPNPANEPIYGEHTFPDIGRLIIKDIACGDTCNATLITDGCRGSCPAFSQDDIACGNPAFNLSLEIQSPGCDVDGTLVTLYPGNTDVLPPTYRPCQQYTSGGLAFQHAYLWPICLGALEGTYSIGFSLWYEQPNCDAMDVDMRRYRLYYEIYAICDDAITHYTDGTLLPKDTSTCSPPVLEFEFDPTPLRPEAGLDCDCCPGGPSGTSIFRITL